MRLTFASCLAGSTAPGSSFLAHRFRRITAGIIPAFALTLLASHPLRAQSVWGTSGDVQINGDFDGDGKLDWAFWRPSTGVWYVERSGSPTSTPVQRLWGLPGDVPVPGDYDGDGKTDYAVWRPSNGTWYVLRSSDGAQAARTWGLQGDVTVQGDYDGDGKTDYAVWRPANGTWYVYQSSNGSQVARTWGVAGDIAMTGDYDGDGKFDFTIWRPSNGGWYVFRSKDGLTSAYSWGVRGDIPLACDYEGDGTNDYGVWRPSTSTIWVIESSRPSPVVMEVASSPSSYICSKYTVGSFPKGLYVRVPGDYDGDNQPDFGVYNPASGAWWLQESSNPGNPMTPPPPFDSAAIPPNNAPRYWDIPIVGDYDGDHKSDIAVFRPSTGQWFYAPSTNASAPVSGVLTDPLTLNAVPVVGDFDGDGRTDFGVFNSTSGGPGIWIVGFNTAGISGVATGFRREWGVLGDIPVTGDFDGDFKSDLAVYRESTGTWWIYRSSDGAFFGRTWGVFGDVPLIGDFNNDGISDMAIKRPQENNLYVFYQAGAAAGTSTTSGLGFSYPLTNQPPLTTYIGPK